MKIKNLSTAPLTFPTGQAAAPGSTIFIDDATWAYLVNDAQVASWLAAGILELNGSLPAPPPGIPITGSVLITQEEYDDIVSPDPTVAYFISVPE